MKILFLHISDMHIDKKTDIDYFHIQKLIDSLHVTGDFDHTIIIVSGDVAYSGKSHQYEISWNFLGHLIKKLCKRYSMKSRPTVLVVPGNHDVDLSMGDLGHAKIQELYRNKQLDSQISQECKKMRNFINFAKGNRCFNLHEQLYTCKKIVLNDFIIEANLLNSALFSTLDEDKGLHYFPQYIINQLSKPSGANFVISIMHHSPHWFNEENKAQLEQILLSKSSLLFLGHEHTLETQDISYNSNPSVQVLAGSMLCNRNDWSKSEYFASTLNTDDFNFTQFGFKWNYQERYYEHKLIQSNNLPSKPSCEKKLFPDGNYFRSFFEDEKHPITKDFSDYFVFPRLQSEERTESAVSNEIIDESKFLAELENKKKIIIVGYDNSGKTALLKHLFKLLLKTKVVLFCDIYSITSGNCNRIVKNVFEDIYGENPADFIRYQQIPKQDKVLIIDDIHLVETRNFGAFIEEVEKIFEYVIYSTKNVMELDILERAKKLTNEDGSYIRYRIMPFYFDKRNELILNIVKTKLPDDVNESIKITNILIDSFKNQRSLFNLSPDFIIQYTEYYCRNIKDATYNDGEIFGKVFEANIVNSVVPYMKGIRVDKLFIILDKVAYYIHSNKAYPLKLGQLTNIINLYNEKYGTDFSVSDFIKISTSAKILVSCGDGFEYKFCNKNYLAYFVAREIKRKYHEENDESDLVSILNYSCFGINGDILLFLTYITDNPNMLRLILKISKTLTDEWNEFDLNAGNVPYLANIKNPLEIAAPTKEQKRLEEKSEIDHEKRQVSSKRLDPIDIYDYKEDDIAQLANQLNRALSLLSVISRCLPNFEHMILKEDKELFVDTIYRLPNQIFYLWATEVENNKVELIEFIKGLQENDYSRDKKLTDDDVLRLLQWDSMSLLLDILNMAASNSTKENTEKYLNSFNYNSGTNYSLQHLMILERREKISEFTKEATKIFDSTKNTMTKTMIMRIARHLLINSKTINRVEIQQLERKYFPSSLDQTNALDHKKLLLQRAQRK